MNHPADSPDLGPGDFFLFGAMKESFSRMRFGSLDELFQGVGRFFEWTFVEWIRPIGAVL
jgi:hypothetical protein